MASFPSLTSLLLLVYFKIVELNFFLASTSKQIEQIIIATQQLPYSNKMQKVHNNKLGSMQKLFTQSTRPERFTEKQGLKVESKRSWEMGHFIILVLPKNQPCIGNLVRWEGQFPRTFMCFSILFSHFSLDIY